MDTIDIDIEELQKLLDSRLTLKECAEIFNCSRKMIQDRVKKYGLEIHRSKTRKEVIHRKGGRKPVVGLSLQQEDMKDIEAEFKGGWDNIYDYID